MLGGLGLPVPKLLRVDTSLAAFPFAYTIFERIEGRDLRYELPEMSDAQVETLAGEVVRCQRAVATLPAGDGYGFVPIGAKGPHQSWTAVVEADQQPWPETTRRASAIACARCSNAIGRCSTRSPRRVSWTM